jgi:hypothetical protein
MRTMTWLVVAASAAAGHAAKLPPPMRLTLIQASCNALPPSLPGPCSATFGFKTGEVVMKAIRQPQPTCPKTGQPSDAPGGDVRMTGVVKSGAPFSGTLDVQASLKTTFGADPDGDCELRNLYIGNFPSLVGTLACTRGKCKGKLLPVACLPAQCGDVPVFSELGTVEVGVQTFGPVVVFDDAGAPLATPGTVLAPAT